MDVVDLPDTLEDVPSDFRSLFRMQMDLERFQLDIHNFSDSIRELKRMFRRHDLIAKRVFEAGNYPQDKTLGNAVKVHYLHGSIKEHKVMLAAASIPGFEAATIDFDKAVMQLKNVIIHCKFTDRSGSRTAAKPSKANQAEEPYWLDIALQHGFVPPPNWSWPESRHLAKCSVCHKKGHTSLRCKLVKSFKKSTKGNQLESRAGNHGSRRTGTHVHSSK